MNELARWAAIASVLLLWTAIIAYNVDINSEMEQPHFTQAQTEVLTNQGVNIQRVEELHCVTSLQNQMEGREWVDLFCHNAYKHLSLKGTN